MSRLEEIKERNKIRKELEKKGIITMWDGARGAIILCVRENTEYREVGYMKNNKIIWNEGQAEIFKEGQA